MQTDGAPVPPTPPPIQWVKSKPFLHPGPDLSGLRFGPWIDATDTRLLELKDRITPFEEQRRWDLAKKMANPFEMVFTHEDPHYHPSITILHPLSRSYFKLIEMLDVLQFFEQLPKQNPKFYTAHVAEGPGGFLEALFDRAEKRARRLESATAMTLKPTDQRVPGWRRAANFLHRHRTVKLHYGVDGTGDIYQPGNQDSFVAQVHHAAPSGAHLFTADGGFDFSINYQVQEHRVFHLLVCSAHIGLRSLQRDGCMVLKFFDIFAEPTKLLIAILGRCFREWTLYKPAISRPCNSERYFLGRGFRGWTGALHSLFSRLQTESRQDRFPFLDVSGGGAAQANPWLTPTEEAFLATHITKNTEDQIVSLNRALHYVNRPEDWYANQLQADFSTSMRWCSKYSIPFTMRHAQEVLQKVSHTSALGADPPR